MTLPEFSLLSRNQQVSILYDEGVYIGKIKQANKTTILYQVESFYVEIFYKKYRYHIESLECFRSTDKILPYLEQVNVEDLVKCV